MERTRILGIDPGSKRLGWVYLIGDHIHMGPGTLELPGNVGDTFTIIYKWVVGQIQGFGQTSRPRHAPALVAIESYFPTRQRGATVIPELRGVIKLAAYQSKIPIMEIAPGTIKKFITGKGNSDKNAVREVVCSMYNLSIKSTDATDALAIALTAYHKTTGWNLADITPQEVISE